MGAFFAIQIISIVLFCCLFKIGSHLRNVNLVKVDDYFQSSWSGKGNKKGGTFEVLLKSLLFALKQHL